MPWSEVVAAVAALLGVALASVMNRSNAKADREARLADERAASDRATEQESILELLAATRLLSQRANGFRLMVKLLQSHGAKRDRRRGVLAPLDVEAGYDRLVDADQRLGQASAKVWLTGSPEAVRLTNKVVSAAAHVFDAHIDEPRRGIGAVVRWVQLHYTKALPGAEIHIAETNAALASANKALAEYAREKYGLEFVDLFDDGSANALT